MSEPRISIIGLGNVLRGDDGFGPALVDLLRSKFEYNPPVQILDVGAPGIDLAPFLYDQDFIVFVDTAKLGEKPGTVSVVLRNDVLQFSVNRQPALSGHESDIQAAIFKTEWEKGKPLDFCLVAAEPEFLDEFPGISATLIDALEGAAETVLEILRSRKIQVRIKSEKSPSPWWVDQSSP